MPLVDLDDPEELRARWGALAAVAHATGFDRRWYADGNGWYHQDETGSDLRMVLLDGDRAVLFGFHTEHSRTGGSDVLVGAPDWIAHPEVRGRIETGRLGFVYGSYAGTWARAAYPGDPWQPLDDGFHSIATWLTSDEDAAEALIHWATAWADSPGDPDELRPVGLALIRQAATTGLTAGALLDLFGRLGVDARSPRQPDVPAGLAAWAQFGGPVPEGPPADDYEVDDYQRDDYDDDDDEQQIIVPPGVSPFTGQLIADAEPGYIEPYSGYGATRFVPADPSPEPVFVEPEPVEDEYELPALARLGLVAPDPVEDDLDDEDAADEDAGQDDSVQEGQGGQDSIGEDLVGEEYDGREADAGDSAGADGVAAEGPGEPPTVPRVGSEVGEGEDYYASLFADAPAATTYRPDMRRSPEADQAPVQSWEVGEPSNEPGAPQDDLAVPFSSPSGVVLGGTGPAVPRTGPYGERERPDDAPADPDDASFPDPGVGPFSLADAAGESTVSDAVLGRPGVGDNAPTADDADVRPILEPDPRASDVADEGLLSGPAVADDDGSADDATGIDRVRYQDGVASSFPDDERFTRPFSGDGPSGEQSRDALPDRHESVDRLTDGDASIGPYPPIDAAGIGPYPQTDAAGIDSYPRIDSPGIGPVPATEAVGSSVDDDALGRSGGIDERPWDDDPSIDPAREGGDAAAVDRSQEVFGRPDAIDDGSPGVAGLNRVRAGGAAGDDSAGDVLSRPGVLDDGSTTDAHVDPAQAAGAAVSDRSEDVLARPGVIDYESSGDVGVDRVLVNGAAADDPAREGVLGRSDVLGGGSLEDDTDIHPVLEFSDADDPATESSSRAGDVIDDVSWDDAGISPALGTGAEASDPAEDAVLGRSDVLGGGSLDDDTDIHQVLDFSDVEERGTEPAPSRDLDPLQGLAKDGELSAESSSRPDGLNGVFSDPDAETGAFAQLEQTPEPPPAQPARVRPAPVRPAPREWIGGAWINGVWVEDAAAYWAEREAAESAGTHAEHSATDASDALSASADALAAPGAQDAQAAPASDDASTEAGRDDGSSGSAPGDAGSTADDGHSWSERERRARAGWPGKARRRLRSDDRWAASGSTGGPGALPNFFAPEVRNLDQPSTARTADSAEDQQSIEGAGSAASSDQGAPSGSAGDDRLIGSPSDRGSSAPDPTRTQHNPNQGTSSSNDADNRTATSDEEVPDDSPTAELAVLSDEELAAMRSEQGAGAGPFAASDPDEEEYYAASRSGTNMAPASDRVDLSTPDDSAVPAQAAGPTHAEPFGGTDVDHSDTNEDQAEADSTDQSDDAGHGRSAEVEERPGDGHDPGPGADAGTDAEATTDTLVHIDAAADPDADARSETEPDGPTVTEMESEPDASPSATTDPSTAANPSTAGDPGSAADLGSAAEPRTDAGTAADLGAGADAGSAAEAGIDAEAGNASELGTRREAGIAAEWGPDSEVRTAADPRTDAEPGTGTGAEAGTEADADAYTDVDAGADADVDAHAHADTDVDASVGTDAGVDAHARADADVNTDAYANGASRSDGDGDTVAGGETSGDELGVGGEVGTDIRRAAAADSGADEVDGPHQLDGPHQVDGPYHFNGRREADEDQYDWDQEHGTGFADNGRFVDARSFVELEASTAPGPFEQRHPRTEPDPFEEPEVRDEPGPVGERGSSIDPGPADEREPSIEPEQADESESAVEAGRAAQRSEDVPGPVAEAVPADEQTRDDGSQPDETAERGEFVASADAEPAARDDDVRQPVRPDELVVPASTPAVPIPGLGLVSAEPLAELAPGSLEAAMRAEQERPRPRPAESAALQALHEWCRARTRILPSGFTIQVQVLDPAAPSYRFDLEPPEVDDPEYAVDRLGDLLGDLWLAEAESEQGGWLFARIDAAGRTLRIDRWYDQVPDWWDNPVEQRLDVPGLLRRLTGRGPEWQPTYLEKLSGLAR